VNGICGATYSSIRSTLPRRSQRVALASVTSMTVPTLIVSRRS